MRFGIFTFSRAPYADIAKHFRVAEELGFVFSAGKQPTYARVEPPQDAKSFGEHPPPVVAASNVGKFVPPRGATACGFPRRPITRH